ncbi:PAS domain-containing sensor histidine kinase [Hymenobacter norwichensis]|uniref:PAS domain-containing sensor histidine kinase n=1 Tax=Hymenobacter norwichensis TaxID=223903 RepID=UPI0003B3AC2F|nr:ATP-binding protein [Hymenobacter norwichensis]
MSYSLPSSVAADTLLHDVLAVSLTGINVLHPLYSPAGELDDFAMAYLNPAAQRMTGLAEEPGSTMRTLFPDTFSNGVFAFYRRVFQTGAADRYSFNYQADGFDNYFHVAARRSGELLIASFTDTADQDRSPVEESLRASQAAEQAAHAVAEQQRQRFREVLTQMPAYIAVYQGPDHIYQFVNPAYQSLFPHRSFLGKPFREGTPESVELGVVALFDQVYQTGEPVYLREMEGWFDFHGNGQPVQVFLNISLHPLRDVQGRIDGVMDFTYDVSEQVRSRQQVEQLNAELETRVQQRTRELSEQRQLLRRILAQVPASIATLTGPEHRFSFFNEPYQQLTAGRAELDRTVAEALPEVIEQGFIGLLDQVYVTGQPYVGRDIPILLDNADQGQPEASYLDFIYQPLFDDAHRVQGILAFILDVTEKVRAREQVQNLNEELAATNEEMLATNEELLDANTRLLRANADLDSFVYAASHDLKAPIANIEGLLNALHEYLPTVDQEPMVPRLVGMMEGAIARFQQTVGHLTDVSHLQQGQYSQPIEHLDVPQALEDVRLDLLPLLESSCAELVVDVATCANVRFSAKHLRSVLFNLLSNAVKYRAPDRQPVVQIRTECTPTEFRLAVQDNGLGLSEYQQSQLFTMFRRLHTHVEGSGVGLYLIKRAVDNAGGTLTVESQLGAGSTFTVTLPRA